MTTTVVRQLVSPPRFGGILWRLARATTSVGRPFAGKRWNPAFGIIEHRGRRSGRAYTTPVAVRRVDGGFVVALAFGAQVDWNRNLEAAQGGTIVWRGDRHPVGAPERIDSATARAAFHLIQRLALRTGRIEAFIRLPDR
jgi:deazaflavin-dependent oxidoreductase (nitroreductase family)